MIKTIVFDLYGVLVNDHGLMHDTADILKLCARHPNLTCYGLSNITETQKDYFVNSYPVLRNLKMIVTSESAGASKPSPRIFEFLTESTKIDPTTSIFIDDNPANCGAAIQLGFQTIHFQNADQLAHEMDNAGVPIFADDAKQTSCAEGCSCHPK
jgi:2-haloacid dehalogenase